RQAIRHQPRWLVITDQQAASRQDWSALPEVTELLLGHEALEELVGSGGLHSQPLRQTVGGTGISSRQPAAWGMPPTLPENVSTNGRAALTADEPEIDIVLGAIVGSAGLQSTWAAVESGRRVALANKETLVMAGPLVMQLAQQ